MAKVNFNKLSLGHPLTYNAVFDNLDQCATALSGNISADQREDNRSIFTFALQKVRLGRDDLTHGERAGFNVPWQSDTGIKSFSFFLPPLQEFFDSSLVSTITTPGIILESMSLSFDCANQQFPINLTTGLPDSGLLFDRDFVAEIKCGGYAGQVTIPSTALNISNDEIVNRPNPALAANIGAIIDAYSELEVTLRIPITQQTAFGLGFQDKGIDNAVLRASFSAPIVQRDTASYSVAPQNDLASNGTARSFSSNSLLKPAAGSLIKAGSRTAALTDGVQDAFEQLDRSMRNKLQGGLTRWSEVRANTEALLEDQGYFCITVPLFNIPEVNACNANVPLNNFFNTIQGYKRPSTLRGKQALMDRAVIPIVAPGTIHHVGVFFDGFHCSEPNRQLRMDLGVGIGCGPGSRLGSYTQVSQVAEKDVTYGDPTEYITHFFAPLAYSSAAGAPAKGKGYVEQGRPFFFGRQVDLTGGVLRSNVANAANPAASEAAPATDGTEQFIEIRCNLYQYDSGTSAYVDIDDLGSTSGSVWQFGGWSGVVVCLYGKMALVE